MLSLSSLLNPVPQGSSIGDGFPPSPESSHPADSYVDDSVFPDRPMMPKQKTPKQKMPKQKMPKDAAVFIKTKPREAINFQPYEDLDEVLLHRIRRFQVYPLGKIREYSRHIPYNSGKKDFFEKTGRESFEVFQYIFKVPGDDVKYTIMWDYNIGLVRMTPFFKCCKYPKTTPAKMLTVNPGLKEITHSITGGSIIAQGYWMPYQCAKAVCATFCHNISEAMIPIFGPDFPALCARVDGPEYGRMVIDPAIVARSTREAEYYLHFHSSIASSNRSVFHSPYDQSSRLRPQYHMRKTFISTPASENSSYTTDTDGEASPVTDRTNLTRDSPHPRLSIFPHSPISSMVTPLRLSHARSGSSSWTPVNAPPSPGHLRPHDEHQVSGPSPWLSAIPRFTTKTHLEASSYSNADTRKLPRSQPSPTTLSFGEPYSQTHHPRMAHRQLPSPSDAPPHLSQRIIHPPPRAKRPAAQIEEDVSPERRHSKIPLRQGPRPQDHQTNKENRAETQLVDWRRGDKVAGSRNTGADKRAALLLMNLSVRGRSLRKSPGPCRETEGPNSSRIHETTHDSCSGGETNRRANVNRPYSDDSSRNGYNHGAGSTARIGGDGVSSETSSPFNGALPRIKRVRSNSM